MSYLGRKHNYCLCCYADTQLRCSMTSPEQKLAFAVILDSYKFFISSNKHDQEEVEFLTGKTTQSLFWFEVAGRCPFTSQQIIGGVL